MLTLVPAAPQIRGVFARTAPEARGDWHQARTWRRLALAAALLLGSLQFEVWAADTTLRPWTDEQLPLFSLDTIGGGHADLAQLRGRVVLVHFFATWCEPCRAELTALQDLAGRLRARSVSIVAIDAGETDSRVNRFFASLPVSFPVLLDRDQATTKAWQVYALPTTFLLDGNLVPRFVAEGDFDWSRPDAEELLTKLIGAKAARNAMPASAPM